jgi:hypothetical protein
LGTPLAFFSQNFMLSTVKMRRMHKGMDEKEKKEEKGVFSL